MTTPTTSDETLGAILRQVVKSVVADALIEAGLVTPTKPYDRPGREFTYVKRDSVNITINGEAMTDQDEHDQRTPAPRFEFDSSGYPTDDTLNRIRLWPPDELPDLMNFINQGWAFTPPQPAAINETTDPITIALFHTIDGTRDILYRATTSGWSGNEDIIRALTMNPAIRPRWLADIKGGLHYWTIPRNNTQHHCYTQA